MNRRFVALAGAALLLRIVVAATPGYPFDRELFIRWAQILADRGPLAIYASTVVPPVDYSPGYLYALWAIGLAHAAIGGGAFSWRVLLEIVPFAGDIAVVSLMYRFARRIASEARAFWFAAVVALAPPLWLDSAAWGQVDALPIALALVALFAALEDGFARAWPSLCAAVIVKPLAVLIAPVFAVLQTRARPPWRGLGVAIVVSFAIAYLTTLPFTSERSPVAVLSFLFERYAGGASKAPFVSEASFTLYPLLTNFTTSDAVRLGPLSFRTWGVCLVVGTASIAATTLAFSLGRNPDRRTRDLRVFGAACLSLLGLFLFATRMHERYMLPALVFGAPLGLVDRASALAIGWLGIAFTLNCVFIMLGFSGDGHHPITLAIARLCSAANIAAFAVLAQRQYRRLTHAV